MPWPLQHVYAISLTSIFVDALHICLLLSAAVGVVLVWSVQGADALIAVAVRAVNDYTFGIGSWPCCLHFSRVVVL